MEFRTAIDIKSQGIDIDHTQHGLAIGSCFAVNIAQKMQRMAMPLTLNPMGILFNPASIALSLKLLHENYLFTEDDLIKSGEQWVSFNHHGSFCALNPQDALSEMNAQARIGSEALKKADYVIITLGTAWVYTLASDGKTVSNCHKLPSSHFIRKRLSIEEVVECFAPLLDSYLKDKKVILTVSPIRHIGDGLQENSLSKSTLIVAANILSDKYPNCHYFPSYEIMMDDLRDYRFYDADMIHPSPLAIDYIWEKFCLFAISDEAVKLFTEITALRNSTEHRPINPNSPSHAGFTRKMAEKASEFQARYPYIDISDIKSHFIK